MLRTGKIIRRASFLPGCPGLLKQNACSVGAGEELPFWPTNSCGAFFCRLQAILIHKGPSAFHGHYATQLRDENNTWWELDDDCTCNLSTSTKSKTGVQLGELQGEPAVKEPKEKKKTKAALVKDPDWNEDSSAGNTIHTRRVRFCSYTALLFVYSLRPCTLWSEAAMR